MKYIGLKIAQGSGIGMRRACVECGAEVEPASRDRDPHDPLYCANCGHKFRRIQDRFTSDELTAILNNAVAQPAEPTTQDVLYIGPGPYIAELVKAADGTAICVLPDEYATEDEAIKAALDEARAQHLPVDDAMTRHWVTKNKQHVVDFGSYSVYVSITSVGEAAE